MESVSKGSSRGNRGPTVPRVKGSFRHVCRDAVFQHRHKDNRGLNAVKGGSLGRAKGGVRGQHTSTKICPVFVTSVFYRATTSGGYRHVIYYNAIH